MIKSLMFSVIKTSLEFNELCSNVIQTLRLIGEPLLGSSF